MAAWATVKAEVAIAAVRNVRTHIMFNQSTLRLYDISPCYVALPRPSSTFSSPAPPPSSLASSRGPRHFRNPSDISEFTAPRCLTFAGEMCLPAPHPLESMREGKDVHIGRDIIAPSNPADCGSIVTSEERRKRLWRGSDILVRDNYPAPGVK